jgi:hypothetical protein
MLSFCPPNTVTYCKSICILMLEVWSIINSGELKSLTGGRSGVDSYFTKLTLYSDACK